MKHVSGLDTDDLLEGSYLLEYLGLNLRVHATDATEITDSELRVVVPPTLTIFILLEGSIDAHLGDQHLCYSAKHGPVAQVWAHQTPRELVRKSYRGVRVRKVHISLPLEWINRIHDEAGWEFDANGLDAMISAGLTAREWLPSRSSLQYAESICHASRSPESLSKLSLSVWAMQILNDAVSQFRDFNPAFEHDACSVVDAARAREVASFVNRNIQSDLDLDKVAHTTHMSVSTLQRVLKNITELQ